MVNSHPLAKLCSMRRAVNCNRRCVAVLGHPNPNSDLGIGNGPSRGAGTPLTRERNISTLTLGPRDRVAHPFEDDESDRVRCWEAGCARGVCACCRLRFAESRAPTREATQASGSNLSDHARPGVQTDLRHGRILVARRCERLAANRHPNSRRVGLRIRLRRPRRHGSTA